MSGSPKEINSLNCPTCIAVDDGGSKALAIRFDKDFRPLAFVKTGSLRQNTNTQEQIDGRYGEIISGLGLKAGDVVESVCGVFPYSLAERIAGTVQVNKTERYGEMRTSLAAAGITGDGLLVISGTGATVFATFNGETCSAGGYGSLISDEGSGYYIARQAFNAAIHGYEGRGSATVLTEIIREKYGKNRDADFREAFFELYRKKTDSLVSEIASLTPLVVKAAEQDAVAKEILATSGRLLGEQLMSLVRMKNVPEGLPVVISGSVWKKNPVFLEAFKKASYGYLSSSKLVVPRFLPVVGGVVMKMTEGGRALSEDDDATLEKNYSDFKYEI